MSEIKFTKLLEAFDRVAETAARRSAQTIGRRSALSAIGKLLVGGAILPVLPFDRSGSARADTAHGAGEADCEYWRYCALDGFLCSCCGGSISACPPGTEPSKVTWVGTCHNPQDGKDYLISYNDCCGKTTCGRCLCNGNVGERPGYRMGIHNDINWCMANTQSMYHCTVSVIVGVAEGK
ncbi:MAG: methylamine dehydrogenase light chain [Xanthobacteraceae bacterium]|nr:methylamine dehydrogenase light chain [Xanthobacteraceae bacterium]